MEHIKEAADLLRADIRSGLLHIVDVTAAKHRELTIEDHHSIIATINVPTAPDIVQSYLNTVKMLYVYAHLYYPLYAITVTHAFMAVELALQVRYPAKRRQGLKKLLRHAVKAGDITNPAEDPTFARRVVASVPRLRNAFAHPNAHSIVTPGIAVEAVQIAAKIINQLWR